MKACCFTGHRDLPAGQEGMIIEKACEVLDRLMEEGVNGIPGWRRRRV